MIDRHPPDSPELRRPNPWAGVTIAKLSVVRSGSPLAFFDLHAPLLEATMCGCTLRRTKAGKLWAAPPKQKRVLPDGTTEWGDFVSWDSGRPASLFSAACLEAIQRHSPELLAPLIEGHGEPAPLALPPRRRDTTELATPPDWWDR
jgi:hypothetical protein